MRRMARAVTTAILYSLETTPTAWSKLDNGRQHSSGLTVWYVPRRWRVFDGVRVTVNNCDVWLPLFCRLRLRRALRNLVLSEAHLALNLPR